RYSLDSERGEVSRRAAPAQLSCEVGACPLEGLELLDDREPLRGAVLGRELLIGACDESDALQPCDLFGGLGLGKSILVHPVGRARARPGPLRREPRKLTWLEYTPSAPPLRGGDGCGCLRARCRARRWAS